LRRTALEAYDRIIGLELSEVAVDCCITKAPCGGEKAGRSPVDRGKAGVKRSVAVDGRGIPLGCVTAPASLHDSPPLLVPTLDAAGALGLAPGGATVHLDRGYDSKLTRERLLGLGLLAEISEKGRPAPLNATRRWVVERTTPGRTPTRSWCGAPRGGGEWWTSGWASRTWSSSSGGWFERAGAATAGRDDPLNDRDLLAEPLKIP
jgi:hypothetical protein